MPITDGPFGSYFGMFADKFGVQCMVDCFVAESSNHNIRRRCVR